MTQSRLADSDKYTDFIKENYRINVEDCNIDSKCFAPAYRNLNGDTKIDSAFSGGYGFLTHGGYSMYVIPGTPATIYVDVNASELPNIIGRDFFTFYVYNDYSIDVISPTDRKKAGAKNLRATGNTGSDDDGAQCKDSENGQECFGRLLNNNWKPDY